jgi:hypothetical protein
VAETVMFDLRENDYLSVPSPSPYPAFVFSSLGYIKPAKYRKHYGYRQNIVNNQFIFREYSLSNRFPKKFEYKSKMNHKSEKSRSM